MGNKDTIEAYQGGVQTVKDIVDEAWNVWRWFFIGLIGLEAYDASGKTATLVFGVSCSVIGVVRLFAWISEAIAGRIKAKASRSGRFVSLSLMVFTILTALHLTLGAYAVIASLAYPVVEEKGG